MWHAISEFFTATASVFLCSIAVKLLDDFLDQEIDACAGRKNWAQRIGNGSTIYAALLLAFAATLQAQAALSLFFACCMVGMFNSLTHKLPSRLSGWQESLLILFFGFFFFGIEQMMFALCFIAAIQLLDDCLDYRLDQISGCRNLAHRFGIIECLLAGTVFMLAAWSLNEQLFLPALLGSGTAYFISCRYQEA